MNANELMVGDYVRNKRTKDIVWVFEIDGDRNVINNEPDGYCSEKNIDIDDIEPIPITPEILEKNGFKKNKFSNLETLFYIENECYDFLYARTIGIPCEFGIGNSFDEEGELQELTTIKYIHELQHILKLCRIEKTIEL